jgi:hypothetical protein
MTPHLFYFIPHSKINSSTHNNFTSNQKNETTRYNKSDLEREIEQTTELPLALQQPTPPKSKLFTSMSLSSEVTGDAADPRIW